MPIRAAIPEDLAAIRELERQADTAAHWTAREYDALFAAEAPKRIVLVAATESEIGQVQGFVIGQCAMSDWEIENVVVAGDCQRQGVATEMIQELIRRAHSSGATSVLLEVRESNLAARRLYESLGFTEQGRRNNYYRDPTEDGLLLKISIKRGEKVP